MPTSPQIPLISLYYYTDGDIFANIYVPSGVNREDFIESFLLEYGEFTPIYQEPSYLKRHITSLGKGLKYALDGLWETTKFEYNPIENYDRHEDSKDVRTPDLTTVNNYGSTVSDSGTDTETHSGGHTVQNGGSDSTELRVAADNTGNYYPSQQTNTSPGSSQTTTYNGEQIASNYGKHTAHGGADTEKLDGTDTNTHTAHIHGNIGVTTTQAMIEEERKVLDFSFFQRAGELYAEQLLILKY